jgi:HK97 family phage portal protein
MLAPKAGGPPVPLSEGGIRVLPSSPGAANLDLALIQAYKRNGTARSNISLLAESVAGTDWALYRTPTQDGRVRYTTSDRGSDPRTEVVQHAALNLLAAPAVITEDGKRVTMWTRETLMELGGIYMETTGKCHWIVDDMEGISPVPLGLWPVRPDRMIPVADPRKYLAGWAYKAPGGEMIPLRVTEVVYNRYPDPDDIYGGCGPLESVLDDIEAAGYAAQWNKNYFVNSAEPGGVIQLDHELQEGEFDELVDRWRETHRGVARAHRIAVLENGATWIPNAHSMRDMDFAALRSVSRDIIREALRMHKVMTGVTDDVNRANAQTGEEVYSSWAVEPRLKRWRGVFNYQLLPLFGKTGEGVEFDFSLPTPVNREQDNLELKTKSEAIAALVAAGYHPDDVCDFVGAPRMRVVEQATQAPALPPGWVPAPPAAAPAGGDGAGAGVPADMLRRAAGWGSPAWDRLAEMAAWNRIGAGTR